MFHIVVCDDDRSITEYLKETLEKKYRRKIECQCVYSAEELLKWLEDLDQGHTNIIILDIALGDDDGIAIAKEIRSKYPQIKVILLSGYAQLASNVFEADPVYFLSKPIDEQKLFSSVEKAMDIVQHQEIKAITVAGSGGKIHRMNVEDFMGPVNVGNDGEYSILDLAKMIIELSNSNSKIIFKPLPSDDPTQRRPDLSLAKEKLGYEPTVHVRDGLMKTIEYFQSVL